MLYEIIVTVIGSVIGSMITYILILLLKKIKEAYDNYWNKEIYEPKNNKTKTRREWNKLGEYKKWELLINGRLVKRSALNVVY